MRIGRAGLFTVLWAVDLGFREFGLLFGDPTGCVGPAGWWKTEVLCHLHSQIPLIFFRSLINHKKEKVAFPDSHRST